MTVKISSRLLAFLVRLVSLVLLATLGTAVLARKAPGYFADEGEMNAQSAQVTRAELASEQLREAGVVQTWASNMAALAQGDLGRSRQFQVPVLQLLRERLCVSGRLLAVALPAGVLFASLCAVPCSMLRTHGAQHAATLVSTLLLTVPVGVMTTACLLWGRGGPATILFLLIAARDFRFLSRALRHQLASPHLIFARACGIGNLRCLLTHALLPLRRDLLALFGMSFVVALNAIIPVEVLFGVPGVGQLAWGAAMNRDLPVLLAVTMLMAICIGATSLLSPVANTAMPAAEAR